MKALPSAVPTLHCSQDARSLSRQKLEQQLPASWLQPLLAGYLGVSICRHAMVFFKALTDLQIFLSPLKTVTFAI